MELPPEAQVSALSAYVNQNRKSVSVQLTRVIALLLAATFVMGSARNASTKIAVGDRIVKTGNLSAGTFRYLRYEIHGDKRIARDIWQRTVAFEVRDGRRMLHMTQRWDEVNAPPGSGSALEQESWFDAATFAPVTHVRRLTKPDGKMIAGYRFGPKGVTGMKELAGNLRSDFSLPYAELPFNFEYDMELLQTLPLRKGLDVDIPFYDAGVDKKADRYHFKVAGAATIAGWDGRKVDCWIVTADYNSDTIKSRFWFDKRSQILVREEAGMPDGGILVKTLLPPEASDSVDPHR